MSAPAKPSQPGPPVLPPYSYSYYPYPSPYNYSFDPQTGQYYVSNNQIQPQKASIQQVQFQDMTNQVTQAAGSSSSESRKRKHQSASRQTRFRESSEREEVSGEEAGFLFGIRARGASVFASDSTHTDQSAQ
ncbi:hypothetical protein K435DRAFT_809132 [Dendrothele bispora CBS 962.96]|uniref:Uncharacterized protein n=1 Tax=Dendrothele bispora (strain CBS 962.96) TaxID=1314807 RepID=A0A4S8KZ96_DENBC|nr:hypothetical protein K435DRAFT_809132 [Dendrothele bispora CBS 962.96]